MEFTPLFQPRPRGGRIVPGFPAGGARSRVLGGLTMLAVVTLLVAAGTARGASGGFERTWGKDVIAGNSFMGAEICTTAASCKYGGYGRGAGEFSGESGHFLEVATDASGSTYVADSDPYRNWIQKFDSSGNFVLAWGKNVVAGNDVTGSETCTVAANCQEGNWGTHGGEFDGPHGVAVDSSGNVYVADTTNNRIQKFDSSGHFLLTWGKDVNVFGGSGFETCNAAALCIAGDPGGLGGELNRPEDLAIGAGGKLYVADSQNHRVQEFDSSGNFLRTWGKEVVTAHPGKGLDTCNQAAGCQAGARGTLGGEFSGVEAVATDTAGNVYVTDTEPDRPVDQTAQRIQKFNVQQAGSSVSFIAAWGKDVVAGNNVTGYEVCTDIGSCQAGVPGDLGGELSLPRGLASDSSGAVYVSDSWNNRIQKFDSSGNFLRTWGNDVAAGGGTGFEICTTPATCQTGSADGAGGDLWFPAGLATDGAGDLYVAEQGNDRIQVFGDAVAPPPPPPSDPPPSGTTGPGAQTGTSGTAKTVNPQCQLLGKKLKKAKKAHHPRKVRRLRRKLRRLGC